jgi:xylose isomerase
MSEQLVYNKGPVKFRSITWWDFANELKDPFGNPVLNSADSLEICKIICWAADQGLLEMTGFHDCDLVPWNPEKPDDDLDEKGPVYEKLMQIKTMLDEKNVVVNTATCNLHSNILFRKGGLTNPDPKIRDLAKQKVKRLIRIGNLLDARHLVYWVARDGWEVPILIPPQAYQWIAEGLNGALEYIREMNFNNFIAGTVEPKPNEPRGHSYLPTAGHAAGFITSGLISDPDFWGVNPELIQHEGMTLLDAITCVRYLIAVKKLYFLHFGNQIKGQFDNDFPPLIGPEHLKETVFTYWSLKQLKWQGTVEIDAHMLRSEGNHEDPTKSRKQFAINCSFALAMVLEMANRINPADLMTKEDSKADLKSMMEMCNLNSNQIDSLMRRK